MDGGGNRNDGLRLEALHARDVCGGREQLLLHDDSGAGVVAQRAAQLVV